MCVWENAVICSDLLAHLSPYSWSVLPSVESTVCSVKLFPSSAFIFSAVCPTISPTGIISDGPAFVFPTNNQWSLKGFLCYLVANLPNVSKCLLGKMCSWQNTTQVTWKIYNVSSYLDFKISYSMYLFLFCFVSFVSLMVIYLTFFYTWRETWEKKPVYVQRKNPDYYKGLFSTAEFDRILRKVIFWSDAQIRRQWSPLTGDQWVKNWNIRFSQFINDAKT